MDIVPGVVKDGRLMWVESESSCVNLCVCVCVCVCVCLSKCA